MIRLCKRKQKEAAKRYDSPSIHMENKLSLPVLFHLFQCLTFRFGNEFPDKGSGKDTHQAVNPVSHTVVECFREILVLVQHWESP